jgi:ferritin-like metal-binding protein YciE
MEEYKNSPALDAALLAVAQSVEHYEISRYGTLKTWAGELGIDGAIKLLDATLQEAISSNTFSRRLTCIFSAERCSTMRGMRRILSEPTRRIPTGLSI